MFGQQGKPSPAENFDLLSRDLVEAGRSNR
jgi:hypothetical protein